MRTPWSRARRQAYWTIACGGAMAVAIAGLMLLRPKPLSSSDDSPGLSFFFPYFFGIVSIVWVLGITGSRPRFVGPIGWTLLCATAIQLALSTTHSLVDDVSWEWHMDLTYMYYALSGLGIWLVGLPVAFVVAHIVHESGQ